MGNEKKDARCRQCNKAHHVDNVCLYFDIFVRYNTDKGRWEWSVYDDWGGQPRGKYQRKYKMLKQEWFHEGSGQSLKAPDKFKRYAVNPIYVQYREDSKIRVKRPSRQTLFGFCEVGPNRDGRRQLKRGVCRIFEGRHQNA